ncbi:phage scaffolding protein [[Clostridium] scindens]|uniref:phage scaffolding protein n=1 Tax=Clostridium scindens (strain JCM 10418 / VPI 12708) TaxID=29347 RepID=UPI00242B14AA|nr:phage scaffolding protein [[Clostridium] scindens]
MKRKELEDLGLEKEAIDKIMDWNGQDIETEKKRADKAEGERDNYKEQLDTATGELEKFKDVKPDELQATIEQLQNDLKAKDDEYAAKEADRIFLDGIKDSIRRAGARNEKAVMALLDIDSLKQSKNQTEDIKKALETVKESDAYLFGSEEPINNPVGPIGGAGGGDTALAAMRAAAGLPPAEK